MSPTDPRHGTPAGYQTHWRDNEDPCQPCAVAKFRYGKSVRIDNAKGEKMRYSSDELAGILAPWITMGLSPTAIATAAGLDGQRSAHFAKTIANRSTVRRGTYRALVAITEDDFAPAAKVYADLTRRRIFSLMAIGHRLADMPINSQGQWRYRSHITVETARLIRDHYRANEAKIGPDRNTQARARNAGHMPPMAWDDPDALAWPGHVTESPDVDEATDFVTVQRILAGEWRLTSSRAERVEVLRSWTGSLAELERLTGWNIARIKRQEAS